MLVKTDAPPEILAVSPVVEVRGSAEPGLAELRALSGEGPAPIYRVWLEEDPDTVWAPGWGPAIDETPLRVSLAREPAPAGPCSSLSLTGSATPSVQSGGLRAALTFGELAQDYRRVEIALRSGIPATTLTLLSRYRMPYEDLDPESERARVRYNLYPTSFAFGFGFRETAAGFEQTMSLGVFDELRLRAEAPGCEPVEVGCDESGDCSAGPGSSG